MKKILSLSLVLIMLFALVACNGNEMQDKIAVLEAKLQAQSSKIAHLEEENESLFNQVCALSSDLYTLQEAYDNGWITKEDLRNICYFVCDGTVYEGTIDNEDKYLFGVAGPDSSWVELDFVPDFELGELDAATERKIQGAVAYWERNNPHWSGKIEDVYCNYFGTYNNCVAVTTSMELSSDVPCVTTYKEIEDVIFEGPVSMPMIWIEKY